MGVKGIRESCFWQRDFKSVHWVLGSSRVLMNLITLGKKVFLLWEVLASTLQNLLCEGKGVKRLWEVEALLCLLGHGCNMAAPADILSKESGTGLSLHQCAEGKGNPWVQLSRL